MASRLVGRIVWTEGVRSLQYQDAKTIARTMLKAIVVVSRATP
jgi:hypothetical protein